MPFEDFILALCNVQPVVELRPKIQKRKVAPADLYDNPKFNSAVARLVKAIHKGFKKEAAQVATILNKSAEKVQKAGNEDEERDEHGRWTSGGGSGLKLTDKQWDIWVHESSAVTAAQSGTLKVGDTPDPAFGPVDAKEVQEYEEVGKALQEVASAGVVTVTNPRGNPGALYRGESFDSVKELKDSYKEGKTVTLGRLTAVTPSLETAQNYMCSEASSRVKATLSFRTTNGKFQGVEVPSSADKEVVFPSGSKWRIDSVTNLGRDGWSVRLSPASSKVQKAGKDSILSRMLNLQLSDVVAAVTDAPPDILADIAKSSGKDALVTLGVGDQGVLTATFERSNDYAWDRAAEMVGKKWVDGELVDNPDARWAIDDTTRQMVHDYVAGGLELGLGLGDIAKGIEDTADEDGNYPFSKGRATTIARTEAITAHNQGALAGYREARDKAGLNVQKEWLADDEACDECQGIADDGPIDLDDDFEGDDDDYDAPPAHPNCRCAVSPVVNEDGGKPADDE